MRMLYHDRRCSMLLLFNQFLMSDIFQSLRFSGGTLGAFFEFCVDLVTAAVAGFCASLPLPSARNHRHTVRHGDVGP